MAAFVHGLDFFALQMDGLKSDRPKTRSASPSRCSTCAGSLPGSASSSPESVYCENVGAPALDIPWADDDDFATTVGVIEVQQVAPPEGVLLPPIAPPPGLEAVSACQKAPAVSVPPGLAALAAACAPPGLSAPPGLGAPQVQPAIPPAPIHWAPTATDLARMPPPPPSVLPRLASGALPCGVPPPPMAPPPPVAAPSMEASTPPEADSPTDGSASPLDFPSEGSAAHRFGMCKPCAFFHTKGCTNGRDCVFCHLCDEKEMTRRKKENKMEKIAHHGRSHTAAASR